MTAPGERESTTPQPTLRGDWIGSKSRGRRSEVTMFRRERTGPKQVPRLFRPRKIIRKRLGSSHRTRRGRIHAIASMISRFSEKRTMVLRCESLDPPMSQLGQFPLLPHIVVRSTSVSGISSCAQSSSKSCSAAKPCAMTAPVASGWSGCRVGLAPHWKADKRISP